MAQNITAIAEGLGVGWGIGQALRKRREQLGLTLDGLGAKSGLHPTIISKVERGERRATAEFLIKLALPLMFNRFELLASAGYLGEKAKRLAIAGHLGKEEVDESWLDD